jgi:hypothetical protein
VSTWEIAGSVLFWLALIQWILLAPAMTAAEYLIVRPVSPVRVALGVVVSLIMAGLIILAPLWAFGQLPIRGPVRDTQYMWGAGLGAAISIAIGVYLRRRVKRAI